MTCCLAAQTDDHQVVVASDSQLNLGETRFFKPQGKWLEYGNLTVLYAGDLSLIQKIASVAPDPASPFTDLQQFQHRLWAMRDELKKEPFEFLTIDEDEGDLSILSGWGDLVTGYDYACVGSEFGWMGMYMAMPKLRKRSVVTVTNTLLSILENVAKLDRTVGGEFFTKVL